MDIFAALQESSFNQHFSQPNLTITTLLLDQNIITQLKNENPQLLQYIQQQKHQFMSQLINYTITLPLQTDNYDRMNRLPYISSQLLAIDSNLIYSQFFKKQQKCLQNPYWQQLLAFLSCQAAYNEILMGYFQKVINNLYVGNKTQTTIVVCDRLEQFMKLLPNGSIVDIIKKCIALLNTPQGAVLQQRKKILNHVINKFVNSDQIIKAACSDILEQLINKFQAFSSGDVLIADLLASQSMLSIYQTQNSNAVNNFLLNLILKTQQKTVNQNDETVPLLVLPLLHKQNLQKYLVREVQSIKDISKSTGTLINQNKSKVRKSNKSLYTLLNLISCGLEQGYKSFINKDIIQFLWNLVIDYPFNNILHVRIRKIFNAIIKIQEIRVIFLQSFEIDVLKTAKQHFDLLRPFVYSIWMIVKQYPSLSKDTAVVEEYKIFVDKYLQPLTQYQIKNLQKHKNTQMKLIVDQEDKPFQYQQAYTAPPNIAAAQPEKHKGSQVFQEFGSTKVEGVKPKTTKQQDPFDFFNSFASSSSSSSSKKVESNGEGKKDIFDNFADFS